MVMKGVCVCPGSVKGRARVIQSMADLDSVEYGEILVLPDSHPMYGVAAMKASGLVCENGGKLSHICIVAMEMGIPCVTQIKGVTKAITNGKIVYLDAQEGTVEWDE